MFFLFFNLNLYVKVLLYCFFVIFLLVYIFFKIIFCLYKVFFKFLFGLYFVGLFGILVSKVVLVIFKFLIFFLKYCFVVFFIL